MLNFTEAEMQEMVIHRVGNKAKNEDIAFSMTSIKTTNDEVQQLLFQYLLNPFQKSKNVNRFFHSTDLQFNEVYMYVSQIFAAPDTLLEQSKKIATHLYENSQHPRIKGGEFYMVYFTNMKFKDIRTDAVGIFRTENKETYLKVIDQEDFFAVDYESGININSLDKGCIVLNIDADQGYKVFIVDTHNKAANEARYWKNEFLRVEPLRTKEEITENYIDMVGRFVSENVVEEEKMKPVELKTKAVQFFEENEVFEMERFEEEVLKQPTYIEAFREYRDQYQESTGVQPPSEFSIAPTSVQTAKKKMKSVIKLDKLCNIYLRNHSPQALELIERGHDTHKGMNYYKIYFNNEN